MGRLPFLWARFWASSLLGLSIKESPHPCFPLPLPKDPAPPDAAERRDEETIPWTADGDRQGQNYYGTFQGVANYYTYLPPHEQAVKVDPAIIGSPLPVPPPGSSVVPPPYNPFGYQDAAGYFRVHQGYPIVEVLRVRERRLPCCGMGVGWFLFFIGFFLGGTPWDIAASLLICARLDRREKPGYIACAIASMLTIIAITTSARHGHGGTVKDRVLPGST